MKENYNMNTRGIIKCDECGRFCKPHDSGVLYGGPLDEEPSDTTFFCKKCVTKFYQHPDKVISGCWWIRPNFVCRIEEKLKNKVN